MTETDEGRRARKKRATMNAIELTAVRLALEKGHAHVTVAEICEAVDISRSTFFNYVPTREAAIFGRPLHMIPFDDAMAVLTADGDDSLLRRLFVIAERSVGSSTVHAEVNASRYRIALEQPETLPMVLAQFAGLSNDLLALVYLWLEGDASRRTLPGATTIREASIIVALVGNALQTLLLEMVGNDDTVIPPEAFDEVVAQQEQVARALGARRD